MSSPRRVAIVTGSASGIGKAIALKLASDGFNVALNDLPGSLHKLEDVAALATHHGVDTILVPGDVSSEADVEKMVGDTVNRFGGLDAVGLSQPVSVVLLMNRYQMIANAGIANPRGVSIVESAYIISCLSD
jgi:NAD(P)-dependent dehydrogenase (short-subunit alcohol dehydrogenase family)